jgi:hypothetical protein
MSRFVNSIFLLCGLILVLAAFPVFGQENSRGLEINKKPLKDLAESVKEKNIDWTKPFLVELEGSLTKEGKFDKEKTKFTKSEGDTELVEVIKQTFEAVSDSGWLGYLSYQGIEKIKISAVQNSENFIISVISQQPTLERANTLSSGLNAIINGALLLDRNSARKLGDDERKLLNAARSTAQEKTVNINFVLPAKDFQEMVKRRISESKGNTTK